MSSGRRAPSRWSSSLWQLCQMMQCQRCKPTLSLSHLPPSLQTIPHTPSPVVNVASILSPASELSKRTAVADIKSPAADVMVHCLSRECFGRASIQSPHYLQPFFRLLPAHHDVRHNACFVGFPPRYTVVTAPSDRCPNVLHKRIVKMDRVM